jgi:hypothetical protein
MREDQLIDCFIHVVIDYFCLDILPSIVVWCWGVAMHETGMNDPIFSEQ